MATGAASFGALAILLYPSSDSNNNNPNNPTALTMPLPRPLQLLHRGTWIYLCLVRPDEPQSR